MSPTHQVDQWEAKPPEGWQFVARLVGQNIEKLRGGIEIPRRAAAMARRRFLTSVVAHFL
jgi:hypothetical protein